MMKAPLSSSYELRKSSALPGDVRRSFAARKSESSRPDEGSCTDVLGSTPADSGPAGVSCLACAFGCPLFCSQVLSHITVGLLFCLAPHTFHARRFFVRVYVRVYVRVVRFGAALGTPHSSLLAPRSSPLAPLASRLSPISLSLSLSFCVGVVGGAGNTLLDSPRRSLESARVSREIAVK